MSINIAIIMGRLTADPTLNTTPGGTLVTNFSVAVDRGYQKAGEERKSDFIDVVAWRNTADFICKYFKKGSMIVVQGEIQTRNYEDKNGNKRKAVEIVASNVNFGESKARDNNTSTADPAALESFASKASDMGIVVEFEEVASDDLPF